MEIGPFWIPQVVEIPPSALDAAKHQQHQPSGGLGWSSADGSGIENPLKGSAMLALVLWKAFEKMY